MHYAGATFALLGIAVLVGLVSQEARAMEEREVCEASLRPVWSDDLDERSLIWDDTMLFEVRKFPYFDRLDILPDANDRRLVRSPPAEPPSRPRPC